MKKILNKIKSFANKIKCWVKNLTKGPLEFLGHGKTGGMIMCALLTTLFLYGCLFSMVSCIIPAPIVVILLFVMVILLVELVAFIHKLIYSGGKRSRFYFLTAWLTLLAAFLIGTQLNNVLSGIVISFLVTLSVDIFGRCVFSFVKTHRFKQVFGYIALFFLLH